MSQAIQYNSSVAMTRHPHLLQRAAALTPALHRQRQAPQAIVEAVADPAALNGSQTSLSVSPKVKCRWAGASGGLPPLRPLNCR